MTETKIGQSVAGRWRVVVQLEDGPVASYRVRDDEGNDAELLLPPPDADLERRIAAASGLRHEHVQAVLDSGRRGGRPYLVRELVTGQSLGDWLRRRGRLEYSQALLIACQLCSVSTAAAESGAPPLAVRPATVTIGADGLVKVDPLGLAAGEDDESYLSPEERRGVKPDQRSDLFRIGLMLHRMLMGRLPRRDGQGRYVPTPPSEEAGELSAELDEALLRALAEDPARRFDDAEEMMRALYLLYAHRPMPVSARPPSWHEDRRFWLYVAIAMGGLALVLALATGMILLPFF